jgi:hypothetical protein
MQMMQDSEKIAFKTRLRRLAQDGIEARISAAREAIDGLQQAANQEEKSSAGDKYETSRAMGHLQKDMYSRQLAKSIKELAALHAVNTDSLYPTAGAGAFVRGEGVAFFIATGWGRQQAEGQTVFFLSPQAPLAKTLQNKKPGDTLAFNGALITILEIF